MKSSKAHHLKAVVDWAELRLYLARGANLGRLQRRIESHLGIHGHHLKTLEGSPSSATVFGFRIQDPASWDGIAAVLALVEEDYGFLHPPTFARIEVSLDVYIEGATRDELAALTAHRYRLMHRPVSDNQRFAGLKGTRGLARPIAVNNLHRLLLAGRVVVLGEFGSRNKCADPITMRVYTKTTDRDGTITLQQDQWRSRWEVTLQNEAMPFASMEEARGFKFEALSKLFHMRIERDDLNAFEERVLGAKLQPGAVRDAPILRRWNSSKTIADRETNDKTYQALKKLTRHMNPKTRGGFRGAKKVVKTENPTI